MTPFDTPPDNTPWTFSSEAKARPSVRLDIERRLGALERRGRADRLEAFNASSITAEAASRSRRTGEPLRASMRALMNKRHPGPGPVAELAPQPGKRRSLDPEAFSRVVDEVQRRTGADRRSAIKAVSRKGA